MCMCVHVQGHMLFPDLYMCEWLQNINVFCMCVYFEYYVNSVCACVCTLVFTLAGLLQELHWPSPSLPPPLSLPPSPGCVLNRVPQSQASICRPSPFTVPLAARADRLSSTTQLNVTLTFTFREHLGTLLSKVTYNKYICQKKEKQH